MNNNSTKQAANQQQQKNENLKIPRKFISCAWKL
jgi:hypothetical protein